MEALKNFCEQLGVLIREARTLQGLTQRELAGMVDLDEKTIQRIEAGSEPTTLRTIDIIAKALKRGFNDWVRVAEQRAA